MRNLDRAAVIVIPKRPFLEWLRFADPDSSGMTLEELQIDPVVYLFQDCADDAEIERHIRCYCAGIFEEQLDGWITGDTLWPIDRTFDVFTRWFAVSFHSMVFDVK